MLPRFFLTNMVKQGIISLYGQNSNIVFSAYIDISYVAFTINAETDHGGNTMEPFENNELIPEEEIPAVEVFDEPAPAR